MAYIMNDSAYLRLDGANAMVGSIPMGGSKITGLGDGTDAGDAVSVSQLNGKEDALPLGFISMYSGDGTNLGTEWALCDGNNGTPNLVNQFVRGTDIAGIGGTGGSNDSVVVSHGHTATASSSSTFTGDNSTGSINSNSGVGGDSGSYGFSGADGVFSIGGDSKSAGHAGDTSVTTYSTASMSLTPTGAVSTSTTVTVDATGVDGTNANIPAYYALAYIMKTA